MAPFSMHRQATTLHFPLLAPQIPIKKCYTNSLFKAARLGLDHKLQIGQLLMAREEP